MENGPFGVNGMLVIEPVALVDSFGLESATIPNHRTVADFVTDMQKSGGSVMREDRVPSTEDGRSGACGVAVKESVVWGLSLDHERVLNRGRNLVG